MLTVSSPAGSGGGVALGAPPFLTGAPSAVGEKEIGILQLETFSFVSAFSSKSFFFLIGLSSGARDRIKRFRPGPLVEGASVFFLVRSRVATFLPTSCLELFSGGERGLLALKTIWWSESTGAFLRGYRPPVLEAPWEAAGASSLMVWQR